MQDSLFDHNKSFEKNYLVLARKYRPIFFHELIGQDVLTKTLTNAIKLNRFPHAIILTGTRGIGKTTTARITAKLMNCQYIDINGDTAASCEKCDNCLGIAASQHPDVLEMDAASHTGVNDIRSIIDNAHYAPISSRYKIYIIDEVHMLSNSAFNALLKTLEEPPPHTLFIFATTEISKIPLTILSRCQRFDLRRVQTTKLKEHYLNILNKENITIEDEAIDIITKAADGSVRDGFSILDQAISLSDCNITSDIVKEMLCINSKAQLVEMFLSLIKGDIIPLLDLAKKLYDAGADPIMIANQLLELIHEVSKYRITGDKNTINYFNSEQQSQQINLLDIPFLSRSWQVLINGIDEIKKSIIPFAALEMVLIRLCYLNSTSSPEELLEQSEKMQNSDSRSKNHAINIQNVEQLLSLLYDKNELSLYYALHNEVAILQFEHGSIVMNLLNTEKDFVKKLQFFLYHITLINWSIEIVKDDAMTMGSLLKLNADDKKAKAAENEIVKEILESFTGSRIIDIKVR